MKKLLGILALSAIATMTWANVDLRTNIQDLYYRGSCEEAGAITMSVNGNDFASASTDDPTFIRIRLDHDAVLCQSLVGHWERVNGQGTITSGFMGQPIYLAMRMEDIGGSSAANPNTVAAHVETVSIVRWIAGENEIWLRVQSSSNDWINSVAQAATVPPSTNNGRVAWTFGITAAKSVQANALVDSNLPANTRDSAYQACVGADPNYAAISTLICVNLEDSTLTAFPAPESTLKFDTIAFKDTAWDGDFGVFTAMPGVAIDKGNQTQTNFSGDDSIARGVEGNCVAVMYKPGKKYARLCLDAGGQGVADNGLILMENRLTIKVSCTDGWNKWSAVDIYNANGGPWGFPVKVDTGNDEVISDLYDSTYDVYDPSVMGSETYFVTPVGTDVDFIPPLKNSGGYYFADEVVMYYTGAGLMATNNTVIINVEVGQFYADAPGSVQIGVAVFVSDKDSRWEGGWPAFGIGPCFVDAFAWSANYLYANDYCPPSYKLAMHEIWDFGAFLSCEYTASTAIFFPYLPKLQGTDFWTGIALVNHGGKDFAAGGGLVGSAYEADGSNWTVEFPALPKKTMQTWLILEDEANGVGFVGAGDDPTEGLFLQPVTSGNDLVFGDARFNMFVKGEYLTTGSTNGDLDGYCLIGNGPSINGSYLARNMPPAQAGVDVPTVIGKSEATLRDEDTVFAMMKTAFVKVKDMIK